MFKCIFDNNSSKLVQEFFQEAFIRKLWPVVLRYLTKDVVFGRKHPNKDIELTFREISRAMIQQHELQMPAWWLRMYPPTTQKLSKK